MIRILNNGRITSRISNGGSYDGEKDMGDLNDWRLLSSDSNDILSGSYGLLTERSTTLYHTYGVVKAAVNKQVEYAIGDGLVFRSQPDSATLGINKDDAKEWGKKFQKIVHYYSQEMNFYEKQAALFRSALYSGDSLLFFERDENGKLVDVIETLNNQINWDYNENGYTLGIKHDKWLRRKGIMKSDGTAIDFQDENGNQNVIQFYIKELARQLRGYPLAYSVINLARNDDTYSDAKTHRAVMESIMVATAKLNGTDLDKQLTSMANTNKVNKSKNTIIETASNVIANVKKLGTGNILKLNNSEDFEFNDIKTASNNDDAFKKWNLNYVAMATGTPPEVILSKYESSFTAHKGALNDFVKSYTKKRKTFERTVMSVWIREVAKDAIAQGLISAPGFFEGGKLIQQAYLQGMYLAPIVGHINPLQEVNAQIKEVNAGFDLKSNMAARRGNEWTNFFPEWVEEMEEYNKVSPEYIAQQVFTNENKESK